MVVGSWYVGKFPFKSNSVLYTALMFNVQAGVKEILSPPIPKTVYCNQQPATSYILLQVIAVVSFFFGSVFTV